jgi:hypothetical protein
MYLALFFDNRVMLDLTIWKLKLPLKIKCFLWYLKRGVILTKDNLIRRNWRGGKQCVFYAQTETIQHIFFKCHFAKFIWTGVHIVLNIPKLFSAWHLFNNWAISGGHKNRNSLTGAAALIWVL